MILGVSLVNPINGSAAIQTAARNYKGNMTYEQEIKKADEH
jgi:hypothetical protein